MRPVAGFTVQTSAAIVAAQFLASIVGTTATGLTATPTATGLLRFLVGNGRWQCGNSRAETFRQTKCHGAHARQTLNILHIATLVTRDEAHRDAFTARTRGTADAVHILFRHIGQLEVEHMADAGNVNAARGNIGCDEDFDFAVTKCLQRSGTLALAFVAVNGG